MTIPATCAGFLKALELFGVLPLVDVVEPAQKLAEEGFILGWDQMIVLATLARESQRCPAIDDVWLPGGFPATPGTRIIQRDLAHLLGKIAAEGRDALYSGELILAPLRGFCLFVFMNNILKDYRQKNPHEYPILTCC